MSNVFNKNDASNTEELNEQRWINQEDDFVDKKTAQFLDWQWVIKKLQAYCFSKLGYNAFRHATFYRNLDDITHSLNKTQEMLYLIHSSDLKSLLNGLKLNPLDIEFRYAMAHEGTFLSSESLFNLASSLKHIDVIKQFLETKKTHHLNPLIGSIRDLKSIQNTIFKVIHSDYSIKDDASPTLYAIRSKKKLAIQKVESKLQQLMKNPIYSDCLQDDLITIRNDRYVIPIKKDKESMLEGIISNISSKGNTVFFEPSAVIDDNNQRIHLEKEEEDEIIRILKQLSDLLRNNKQDIQSNFEQITQIDVIFAKAQLSLYLNGKYPTLNTKGIFKLIRASHPILIEQYAGKQTPIDIVLGKDYRLLIISGPNTGGKTLALKTIGLLSLMLHSGILLPLSEDSEFAICNDVLSHYGDTQDIYHGLSSFSSHIKELITLLEKAKPHSLILIDEPISNTDPKQGSALGNAILEQLIRIGSKTMVSTHYQEIKHHFIGIEYAMNASLYFDQETGRPTFQIQYQHIGESQALSIAKQLGLDQVILQRAQDIYKSICSPLDEKKSDFLLASQQIEQTKQQLKQMELQLKQKISALSVKESALTMQSDLLAKEKKQWKQARLNKQKDIVLSDRKLYLKLITELNQIKENIKQDRLNALSKKALNQFQHLDKTFKDIKKQSTLLNTPKSPSSPKRSKGVDVKLKINQRVYVKSIHQEGQICHIDKKQIQVQLGHIILTTTADNLEFIADHNASREEKTRYSYSVELLQPSQSPPFELHVRGERLEEAMRHTQLYIENLHSHGRQHGRIVHGKGLGILKEEIHKMLRTHPYIKQFSLCQKGQGEHGVTEIELI